MGRPQRRAADRLDPGLSVTVKQDRKSSSISGHCVFIPFDATVTWRWSFMVLSQGFIKACYGQGITSPMHLISLLLFIR